MKFPQFSKPYISHILVLPLLLISLLKSVTITLSPFKFHFTLVFMVFRRIHYDPCLLDDLFQWRIWRCGIYWAITIHLKVICCYPHCLNCCQMSHPSRHWYNSSSKYLDHLEIWEHSDLLTNFGIWLTHTRWKPFYFIEVSCFLSRFLFC